MCALYAGIAGGGSNLRIDASRLDESEAGYFRESVLEDVVSMLQTPNGRELLESLAGAKAADGTPRTTTISGTPLPQLGSMLLDNELPATAATDADAEGRRYDGTGANMTVGHWTSDQREDARSDVRLFRELVRALHGVQGDTLPGNLAPNELLPEDRNAVIDRQSYVDVGLGAYATGPKSHLSENGYRRARQALGKTAQKREEDHDAGLMGLRASLLQRR